MDKHSPDMKRERQKLALRLMAYRLASDLSQTEISELCELQLQSWNQYETARNRPTIDSAIAIAQHTPLTLDFIFLGRWDTLPGALALKMRPIYDAQERKARAVRNWLLPDDDSGN